MGRSTRCTSPSRCPRAWWPRRIRRAINSSSTPRSCCRWSAFCPSRRGRSGAAAVAEGGVGVVGAVEAGAGAGFRLVVVEGLGGGRAVAEGLVAAVAEGLVAAVVAGVGSGAGASGGAGVIEGRRGQEPPSTIEGRRNRYIHLDAYIRREIRKAARLPFTSCLVNRGGTGARQRRRPSRRRRRPARRL